MVNVSVEYNVPVPMRDGTVLRADVFWPEGDGPFPVVVERTPYDKTVRSTVGLFALEAARAGYIVVSQDSRGSFTSEGEWTPWKFEREDGYDTIEWAAKLPKSNGKVGTFGASYTGSTQWSSAIAQAPHLAAMVPMVTWNDPENGLLFRGGAIEVGLNLWWGLVTTMAHLPNVYPPEEAFPKLMEAFSALTNLKEGVWELPAAAQPHFVRLGMPDLGVARAFEDPATLSDSRVAGREQEITTPSLNFAGWYDLFGQGSLDNYIAMRARGVTTRLVVGPWTHTSTAPFGSLGEVGEVNFGISALAPNGKTIHDMHIEWYDHFLRDMPATEAHESGVLLFIMGANQWRAESDWPLARAVTTPLYLGEDSSLTWEPAKASASQSEYVYDPANPVMTVGGNVYMGADYLGGPRDQRVTESRDDVLVFTTEPLEQDTEITGRISATLFAVTDGPSTDWVVRLCEVDSAGVSRNVVDGITRAQMEPGQVKEVTIDLWSTAILIRAGHRLRVQVTSSNFPRWDRNLNTGESPATATTARVANQRILHDSSHPSRVELPIIP